VAGPLRGLPAQITGALPGSLVATNAEGQVCVPDTSPSVVFPAARLAGRGPARL